MQIDVIEIIEEDDGSCVVTMEADKEAKEFLMELGWNQLLKTYSFAEAKTPDEWAEAFEEQGVPDENSV